MCGIGFLLRKGFAHYEELLEAVARRGPDHQGTLELPSGMVFLAGVLSIRPFSAQPAVSESGDVLVFNGEIYGHDEQSDTQRLLRDFSRTADDAEMLRVFTSLDGPCAWVYYCASRNALYFGRSFLGQRSLLFTPPRNYEGRASALLHAEEDYSIGEGRLLLEPDEPFVICSVAVGDGEFWPVPAGSMCVLDLDSLRLRVMRMTAALPVFLEDRRHLFLQVLLGAARKRVSSLPPGESPVRVLFSGGVDSLMVAALLHQCCASHVEFQLINVAFLNFESAKDRKCGRAAHAELQRLYPRRVFHFVAVDVTPERLEAALPSVVSLVSPRNSLMDCSIASVLYFAFEACGDAKVVFLGSGADELMAGYTRHRARAERAPEGTAEAVLRAELRTDVLRMAYRNMGRDDRIAGHFGVESRHVFLDKEVVAFIFAHLPAVLGKQVMRDILREQLGVEAGLCETPKRAMQFGTSSDKCLRKIKKITGRQAKGNMQI